MTHDKMPDIMVRDIIPDIHGDLHRLTTTLTALGYRLTTIAGETRWRPPAGHCAAFLGDFIDGGSRNRDVLRIVRSLHDAGDAVAVMGNHELNAVLYHSRGRSWGGVQDGWMRAHTPGNTNQHRHFLAEYPEDDADRRSVLNWFRSLPMALDLGDLRLVHACWSTRALQRIAARCPQMVLSEGDLQEIALEATGFAAAVAMTVKGPEVDLPAGIWFRDFHGGLRTRMRLCWWRADRPRTYRAAALSVPRPEDLPDLPMPQNGDAEFYAPDAVPVCFGHYKLTGDARAELCRPTNAICLDWPAQRLAWRYQSGQTGQVVWAA